MHEACTVFLGIYGWHAAWQCNVPTAPCCRGASSFMRPPFWPFFFYNPPPFVVPRPGAPPPRLPGVRRAGYRWSKRRRRVCGRACRGCLPTHDSGD